MSKLFIYKLNFKVIGEGNSRKDILLSLGIYIGLILISTLIMLFVNEDLRRMKAEKTRSVVRESRAGSKIHSEAEIF